MAGGSRFPGSKNPAKRGESLSPHEVAWHRALVQAGELLVDAFQPPPDTDSRPLTARVRLTIVRSFARHFGYPLAGPLTDDSVAARLTFPTELWDSAPPAHEISSWARGYEWLLEGEAVCEQGRWQWRHGSASRRASGSYFTPRPLVDQLMEATLAADLLSRVRREVFAHFESNASATLPPLGEWSADERRAAEKVLLATRVCDPACGPGVFLQAAADFLSHRLAYIRRGDEPIESTESAESDLANARDDVVTHCLFSVDLDPAVALLARVLVWQTTTKSAAIARALERNFRCGDALFLDWTSEFSCCSSGTAEAGFDVVLGNPPFANAIEGQVDGATKARLSRDYPELIGTADLAYYFLVLGHRLATAKGAVGFVLPRGILTARSAQTFREMLLTVRPPSLIVAPRSPFLFAGANIFVTLLALRRGGACLAAQDDEDWSNPRLDVITLTSGNWWAPLVDQTAEARSPGPRLGDSFDVFASMTTGMAYDLIPFVVEQADAPEKKLLRFVTTGLIDPGICRWGRKVCRYLKKQYQRPVIRMPDDLPAIVRTRLDKVRRPKVLVAGLSNRVEAYFDERAKHCGAVSTFTIVHPEDDADALAQICEYLNSPDATAHLQRELGAHAMGGGRITLSKDFLRNLPFRLAE